MLNPVIYSRLNNKKKYKNFLIKLIKKKHQKNDGIDCKYTHTISVLI